MSIKDEGGEEYLDYVLMNCVALVRSFELTPYQAIWQNWQPVFTPRSARIEFHNSRIMEGPYYTSSSFEIAHEMKVSGDVADAWPCMLASTLVPSSLA